MMKRTIRPAPAQSVDSHRPARCYHRVVSEVAGNQRQIGVGVLVLASVLVPGLLTAGCYYPSPSFTPPMSSPEIDAGADSGAGDAGADANTCFGTAPFRVCLKDAPTQSLNISQPGTINTGDPSKCVETDPKDSFGCVLAATTITVGATLRAYGSRPLVLIASDTIKITPTGSVDVGSHRGATGPQELGASADPTCTSSQLPMNGGGGAGGSFAGRGGKGGGSVQFSLWTGGMPAPAVAGEVNQLRGGCAGQSGGSDNATGPQARAGHGGGAVLLIAGRAIELDVGGVINAAGEGGEGGVSSPRGGGGGGGSGGMIVLDAPAITSSGLLLANGGGGGGGGSSNSSGTPGADPSAVGAATGGGGGMGGGGTDGGGGGSGSTSADKAVGGDGADGGTLGSSGAGGGGGGSNGIVKTHGSSLGSPVSPPLQAP